ncbi:hypothetical protein LA080_010727 [Diaporthe eres]|uniref:C2H2-type domain-containing protein n=1 Tax=Diaporthe vaccinii TaxID=105482 RepID=A0ABR4E3J6_9PEZI|nr:hypothetical protein LA080_010727 [Diaporthe eres]
MGSEKKDGPFVGLSNTRMPSLAAVDRLHWARSPRSQCSPTSSPDPASTAKSSSSDMSLSCVTRGTSRDDCSYSRFLAWAAVQRNASRFMSSSDRLSCPLIRCRKQLPDHESMLKHLASCPQLPTREYWCYDHMRVEHFDDAKCKRCISHPSRRRRMLSMAKGFFSTLGHKSKRGPELEFDVDDTTALAPPSYLESLSFDPPAEPELSSTEILEIDSTEVVVTQAPVDAVPIVDPQDLMLPELDSTMIPSQAPPQWQPELWDVPQSSNRLTAAAPMYESVPSKQPASLGHSQDTPFGQQGPRPVPAASRSKYLSPSSSVRSTTSTMSNVSNISSVTAASSLWSTPSTAWSGFETNLTTPSTGLISPVDMCPEHDFPDLAKRCPSDPLDMLPELPELEADMPAMPELSSGDFFSFDTDLTKLSYPDNFVLEEENIEPSALHPAEAQGSGPIQSETKSLVASAWDALQEHIVSSADKIQHIQNNPLVDQLKLLSAKTIAQRGFSSLRGILESRPSASPLDTLCLVHVIYSFALVVYGDDATRRSSDFYTQSLLYSTWFTPDNQAFYREVVKAIWQPGDMTLEQLESLKAAQAGQPGWPHSVKGKERATRPSGGITKGPDPLVTTALHFLDELEISAVLGASSEASASDLHARHSQDGAVNCQTATPIAENVARLFNALSILVNQYHNVVGLIAELSNVNQGISGGLILSTRRFELEALQAGQSCIVPVQYFDDYVPMVRSLCDPIYELDSSPEAPQRQHYYSLSMALSEALIAELDAAPLDAGEISELESDDDALFDCIIDSLTPSLTDDFIMDMGMDMETQPLLSLEQEEVSKSTDLGKLTHKSTHSEDSTSASSTESPSSTAFRPKNALQTPVSPTSPPQQKPEMADACCELCGYRPKGDPRWFHGSMAKHKKTQHSTDPPKIYKCPYPGCVSAYKNRPDNLRQHQIEKNHFVDGHDGASRRPSKRKKMA